MSASPKVIIAIAILLLVALITWLSKPTRLRYYIAIGNQTHGSVRDVWVYYGNDIAAAPGNLPPGGTSSYGLLSKEFPSYATIRWIDEQGTEHSAEIRMAGDIDVTRKTLKIWFMIHDNGKVSLHVAEHADLEADLEIRKPLQRYYSGSAPSAACLSRQDQLADSWRSRGTTRTAIALNSPIVFARALPKSILDAKDCGTRNFVSRCTDGFCNGGRSTCII